MYTLTKISSIVRSQSHIRKHSLCFSPANRTEGGTFILGVYSMKSNTVLVIYHWETEQIMFKSLGLADLQRIHEESPSKSQKRNVAV